MYCTKCGAELPAQTNFCPKCGAPVMPVEAAPTQSQPERKPIIQVNIPKNEKGTTAPQQNKESEILKKVKEWFLSRKVVHLPGYETITDRNLSRMGIFSGICGLILAVLYLVCCAGDYAYPSILDEGIELLWLQILTIIFLVLAMVTSFFTVLLSGETIAKKSLVRSSYPLGVVGVIEFISVLATQKHTFIMPYLKKMIEVGLLDEDIGLSDIIYQYQDELYDLGLINNKVQNFEFPGMVGPIILAVVSLIILIGSIYYFSTSKSTVTVYNAADIPFSTSVPAVEAATPESSVEEDTDNEAAAETKE